MFVLEKSGEIIRNKENVAQVFNKFVVNKMKNILVNKIGHECIYRDTDLVINGNF